VRLSEYRRFLAAGPFFRQYVIIGVTGHSPPAHLPSVQMPPDISRPYDKLPYTRIDKSELSLWVGLVLALGLVLGGTDVLDSVTGGTFDLPGRCNTGGGSLRCCCSR